MYFNYKKLSQYPRIFRKLTGLSLHNYHCLLNLLINSFDQAFPKKGRKPKIKTYKDRFILILLYYRCYVTHEFIGYFVGLDETNICRLFARIEPLIAGKVHIKKDRKLTEEAGSTLLIDVTEQPIQRPKDKKASKFYYSGKKKRHTQKTEITMKTNGKIIDVSKTTARSVHDITIRRNGSHLPTNANKYGDLGYQGWQKKSNNVHLPYKKIKNSKLTHQQRKYNREHNKIRIAVEHQFDCFKKFRILADVYRNFRKKHNLRFNIIAGILNFQAGF